MFEKGMFPLLNKKVLNDPQEIFNGLMSLIKAIEDKVYSNDALGLLLDNVEMEKIHGEFPLYFNALQSSKIKSGLNFNEIIQLLDHALTFVNNIVCTMSVYDSMDKINESKDILDECIQLILKASQCSISYNNSKQRLTQLHGYVDGHERTTCFMDMHTTFMHKITPGKDVLDTAKMILRCQSKRLDGLEEQLKQIEYQIKSEEKKIADSLSELGRCQCDLLSNLNEVASCVRQIAYNLMRHLSCQRLHPITEGCEIVATC